MFGKCKLHWNCEWNNETQRQGTKENEAQRQGTKDNETQRQGTKEQRNRLLVLSMHGSIAKTK